MEARPTSKLDKNELLGLVGQARLRHRATEPPPAAASDEHETEIEVSSESSTPSVPMRTAPPSGVAVEKKLVRTVARRTPVAGMAAIKLDAPAAPVAPVAPKPDDGYIDLFGEGAESESASPSAAADATPDAPAISLEADAPPPPAAQSPIPVPRTTGQQAPLRATGQQPPVRTTGQQPVVRTTGQHIIQRAPTVPPPNVRTTAPHPAVDDDLDGGSTVFAPVASNALAAASASAEHDDRSARAGDDDIDGGNTVFAPETSNALASTIAPAVPAPAMPAVPAPTTLTDAQVAAIASAPMVTEAPAVEVAPAASLEETPAVVAARSEPLAPPVHPPHPSTLPGQRRVWWIAGAVVGLAGLAVALDALVF